MLNKLKNGRGNLIKSVEDIKKLGAKASKELPPGLDDLGPVQIPATEKDITSTASNAFGLVSGIRLSEGFASNATTIITGNTAQTIDLDRLDIADNHDEAALFRCVFIGG